MKYRRAEIIFMNFIFIAIHEVSTIKSYYAEMEFMEPGFVFEDLDQIDEVVEKSLDCPGVNHIITSYRYPILEEDGIFNDTVKTVTIRTDTIKEEILVQSAEATISLGEKIIQPHLNCKSQEDPELITIVKEEYLDPPSLLPYNFPNFEDPVADGQSMMVDHRYFQDAVKGGFFIEAGALDGYTGSTTLYLELRHKWTGLLVEPMMQEYKELRGHNRKAWSINSCLSPEPRPATVQFSMSMSSDSTMVGIVQEGESKDAIVIQCLPLSTMILALGNPRVDFLSLDIEGAEFDILKNLLWDRIDIRAISVETQFVDKFDVSAQQLDNLLTARGFLFLDKISRDSVYVQIPRPDLLAPRKNLPTQSRKVPGQEVLTRQHYPFPYRLCQMFYVETENLAEHCRVHFPLDYYRDIDVNLLDPCVKIKQCPNNKKVLELSAQCPVDVLSLYGTLDRCNLIVSD